MGLEICKCKVTQQSTELQIDANFPTFFVAFHGRKTIKNA